MESNEDKVKKCAAAFTRYCVQHHVELYIVMSAMMSMVISVFHHNGADKKNFLDDMEKYWDQYDDKRKENK